MKYILKSHNCPRSNAAATDGFDGMAGSFGFSSSVILMDG